MIHMIIQQNLANYKETLHGYGRQITVLRRGKLFDPKKAAAYLQASASRTEITSFSLSSVLNKLFQEAYTKMCFSVKSMVPCQVSKHYMTELYQYVFL